LAELQTDRSCIFCRIVDGREPASIVHQDDRVVAFMDIRPVVAGHVLVVPRQHAASLEALQDEDGAAMFALGKRVAQALRRSITRCEAVNLFLADGAAAGQTVFHMHLHVLPRHAGDGLMVRSALGLRTPPGRETLEAQAASLRAALAGG
jgi:diadenosine tetraphosphate (Ap4A) HIT family hydrolase